MPRAVLLLALLPVLTMPFSNTAWADTDHVTESNSVHLVYAGAASADITPPVGVPLAGHGSFNRRLIPYDVFHRHKYATYLKPSKGLLDPIRAKAFLIKRADKKLLFISMDLVAVNAKFRADLAAKLAYLGFTADDIFVSGTHTHNGPGTITENWFWQIAAADKYIPEIYNGMIDKVVGLVHRLNDETQLAFLFSASFEAKDLQQNRRGQPGHFDPTANLLVAKSILGDWLGGIANMAIHGTALAKSNLLYSADVPGGIERTLESRLADINGPRSKIVPAIAFINGAEGDVAPAMSGIGGIIQSGIDFSEQAVQALKDPKLVEPTWSLKKMRVEMGKPYLHLKACVDVKWLNWLIWSGLNLNLKSAFPKYADIEALQLGNQLMVTWPGEPTTSLGLSLKDIGAEAGFDQTWVLGLTNDHLSYFVTPEEYKVGGYEACASMYGPEGGTRIIAGYRKLLLNSVR